MDAGLTAAEIDIELIAPALFLVGEKWATGEISVADEHLASEIALRVLALQREARRAQRSRRGARRVLLLAPEGERHVIGLQHGLPTCCCAAGYDTCMLGADVPLADIGRRPSRATPPTSSAFTATMPDTRRAPRRRDRLPARPRGPACAVLLGGSAVPFEVAAGWGAAVCADVSDAVASVDALVHRAPLN